MLNKRILIKIILLSTVFMVSASYGQQMAYGKPYNQTSLYCFSNDSIPLYREHTFTKRISDPFPTQSCSNRINAHWSNFGMKNWRPQDHLYASHDPYGGDHPCDRDRLLNRVLTALEMLRRGRTTQTHVFGDYLNDSYNLAAQSTKSLGPVCAISIDGKIYGGMNLNASGHISISLDTMKRTSWMDMPALLVHEAGHLNKNHNSTKCKRERSCDTNLAYKGANTHTLMWLLSYGLYADGADQKKAFKEMALSKAKYERDNAFETVPNIYIP